MASFTPRVFSLNHATTHHVPSRSQISDLAYDLIQFYRSISISFPFRSKYQYGKDCLGGDLEELHYNPDLGPQTTSQRHNPLSPPHFQPPTLHRADLSTNLTLGYCPQDFAYRVYISEVISQQTQISRCIQIFNDWMAVYPTLSSVLEAILDNKARVSKDVKRIVAGAGFYGRFEKLLAALAILAERNREVIERNEQIIKESDTMKEYHMSSKTTQQSQPQQSQPRLHPLFFPQTYDELIALPGVGPYIAAAIMTFSYGVPIPPMDVNLNRTLSRILGIHTADFICIDDGEDFFSDRSTRAQNSSIQAQASTILNSNSNRAAQSQYCQHFHHKSAKSQDYQDVLEYFQNIYGPIIGTQLCEDATVDSLATTHNISPNKITPIHHHHASSMSTAQIGDDFDTFLEQRKPQKTTLPHKHASTTTQTTPTKRKFEFDSDFDDLYDGNDDNRTASRRNTKANTISLLDSPTTAPITSKTPKTATDLAFADEIDLIELEQHPFSPASDQLLLKSPVSRLKRRPRPPNFTEITQTPPNTLPPPLYNTTHTSSSITPLDSLFPPAVLRGAELFAHTPSLTPAKPAKSTTTQTSAPQPTSSLTKTQLEAHRRKSATTFVTQFAQVLMLVALLDVKKWGRGDGIERRGDHREDVHPQPTQIPSTTSKTPPTPSPTPSPHHSSPFDSTTYSTKYLAAEIGQGLMDLSRTICDTTPLCASCPVSSHCMSYKQVYSTVQRGHGNVPRKTTPFVKNNPPTHSSTIASKQQLRGSNPIDIEEIVSWGQLATSVMDSQQFIKGSLEPIKLKQAKIVVDHEKSLLSHIATVQLGISSRQHGQQHGDQMSSMIDDGDDEGLSKLHQTLHTLHQALAATRMAYYDVSKAPKELHRQLHQVLFQFNSNSTVDLAGNTSTANFPPNTRQSTELSRNALNSFPITAKTPCFDLSAFLTPEQRVDFIQGYTGDVFGGVLRDLMEKFVTDWMQYYSTVLSSPTTNSHFFNTADSNALVCLDDAQDTTTMTTTNAVHISNHSNCIFCGTHLVITPQNSNQVPTPLKYDQSSPLSLSNILTSINSLQINTTSHQTSLLTPSNPPPSHFLSHFYPPTPENYLLQVKPKNVLKSSKQVITHLSSSLVLQKLIEACKDTHKYIEEPESGLKDKAGKTASNPGRSKTSSKSQLPLDDDLDDIGLIDLDDDGLDADNSSSEDSIDTVSTHTGNKSIANFVRKSNPSENRKNNNGNDASSPKSSLLAILSTIIEQGSVIYAFGNDNKKPPPAAPTNITTQLAATSQPDGLKTAKGKSNRSVDNDVNQPRDIELIKTTTKSKSNTEKKSDPNPANINTLAKYFNKSPQVEKGASIIRTNSADDVCIVETDGNGGISSKIADEADDNDDNDDHDDNHGVNEFRSAKLNKKGSKTNISKPTSTSSQPPSANIGTNEFPAELPPLGHFVKDFEQNMNSRDTVAMNQKHFSLNYNYTDRSNYKFNPNYQGQKGTKNGNNTDIDKQSKDALSHISHLSIIYMRPVRRYFTQVPRMYLRDLCDSNPSESLQYQIIRPTDHPVYQFNDLYEYSQSMQLQCGYRISEFEILLSRVLDNTNIMDSLIHTLSILHSPTTAQNQSNARTSSDDDEEIRAHAAQSKAAAKMLQSLQKLASLDNSNLTTKELYPSGPLAGQWQLPTVSTAGNDMEHNFFLDFTPKFLPFHKTPSKLHKILDLEQPLVMKMKPNGDVLVDERETFLNLADNLHNTLLYSENQYNRVFTEVHNLVSKQHLRDHAKIDQISNQMQLQAFSDFRSNSKPVPHVVKFSNEQQFPRWFSDHIKTRFENRKKLLHDQILDFSQLLQFHVDLYQNVYNVALAKDGDALSRTKRYWMDVLVKNTHVAKKAMQRWIANRLTSGILQKLYYITSYGMAASRCFNEFSKHPSNSTIPPKSSRSSSSLDKFPKSYQEWWLHCHDLSAFRTPIDHQNDQNDASQTRNSHSPHSAQFFWTPDQGVSVYAIPSKLNKQEQMGGNQSESESRRDPLSFQDVSINCCQLPSRAWTGLICPNLAVTVQRNYRNELVQTVECEHFIGTYNMTAKLYNLEMTPFFNNKMMQSVFPNIVRTLDAIQDLQVTHDNDNCVIDTLDEINSIMDSEDASYTINKAKEVQIRSSLKEMRKFTLPPYSTVFNQTNHPNYHLPWFVPTQTPPANATHSSAHTESIFASPHFFPLASNLHRVSSMQTLADQMSSSQAHLDPIVQAEVASTIAVSSKYGNSVETEQRSHQTGKQQSTASLRSSSDALFNYNPYDSRIPRPHYFNDVIHTATAQEALDIDAELSQTCQEQTPFHSLQTQTPLVKAASNYTNSVSFLPTLKYSGKHSDTQAWRASTNTSDAVSRQLLVLKQTLSIPFSHIDNIYRPVMLPLATAYKRHNPLISPQIYDANRDAQYICYFNHLGWVPAPPASIFNTKTKSKWSKGQQFPEQNPRFCVSMYSGQGWTSSLFSSNQPYRATGHDGCDSSQAGAASNRSNQSNRESLLREDDDMMFWMRQNSKFNKTHPILNAPTFKSTQLPSSSPLHPSSSSPQSPSTPPALLDMSAIFFSWIQTITDEKYFTQAWMPVTYASFYPTRYALELCGGELPVIIPARVMESSSQYDPKENGSSFSPSKHHQAPRSSVKAPLSRPPHSSSSTSKTNFTQLPHPTSKRPFIAPTTTTITSGKSYIDKNFWNVDDDNEEDDRNGLSNISSRSTPVKSPAGNKALTHSTSTAMAGAVGREAGNGDNVQTDFGKPPANVSASKMKPPNKPSNTPQKRIDLTGGDSDIELVTPQHAPSAIDLCSSNVSFLDNSDSQLSSPPTTHINNLDENGDFDLFFPTASPHLPNPRPLPHRSQHSRNQPQNPPSRSRNHQQIDNPADVDLLGLLNRTSQSQSSQPSRRHPLPPPPVPPSSQPLQKTKQKPSQIDSDDDPHPSRQSRHPLTPSSKQSNSKPSNPSQSSKASSTRDHKPTLSKNQSPLHKIPRRSKLDEYDAEFVVNTSESDDNADVYQVSQLLSHRSRNKASSVSQPRGELSSRSSSHNDSNPKARAKHASRSSPISSSSNGSSRSSSSSRSDSSNSDSGEEILSEDDPELRMALQMSLNDHPNHPSQPHVDMTDAVHDEMDDSDALAKVLALSITTHKEDTARRNASSILTTPTKTPTKTPPTSSSRIYVDRTVINSDSDDVSSLSRQTQFSGDLSSSSSSSSLLFSEDDQVKGKGKQINSKTTKTPFSTNHTPPRPLNSKSQSTPAMAQADAKASRRTQNVKVILDSDESENDVKVRQPRSSNHAARGRRAETDSTPVITNKNKHKTNEICPPPPIPFLPSFSKDLVKQTKPFGLRNASIELSSSTYKILDLFNSVFCALIDLYEEEVYDNVQ